MNMGMPRASVLVGALSVLCCQAPDPGPLFLAERASEGVTGDLSTDELQVELESTPSQPLAGVVSIHIQPSAAGAQPIFYELHYDYATGVITSDGHGAQLDRQSLRALGDAAERLARELGSNDPTLPLHEQMLFAALVLLSESGGMPLWPLTFTLHQGDAPDAVGDKSMGDDGVACLQRGSTYLTSYDFGDTVVTDRPVTADSRSCNGMCGPSCTELTPWRMWTLDCLEHDTCCSAIGDGTTCWTPLGECGDEYVVAETDFLRGFDPLRRHCGG